MNIFQHFRAHGDPEKAQGMAKYMRNQFTFLGIQTPERKILGRDFLKGAKKPINWDFVYQCWSEKEREFQYFALDYLTKFKRALTFADLEHLKKLALAKSWWDTVDRIGPLIGDLAMEDLRINQVLLDWSKDENIWLCRIAIIHQLKRKEQTDPELLEQILVVNLNQQEFFINKAIGWSLRQYSKTNPAWVKNFIATHQAQMAPLSIREGSKYL